MLHSVNERVNLDIDFIMNNNSCLVSVNKSYFS